MCVLVSPIAGCVCVICGQSLPKMMHARNSTAVTPALFGLYNICVDCVHILLCLCLCVYVGKCYFGIRHSEFGGGEFVTPTQPKDPRSIRGEECIRTCTCMGTRTCTRARAHTHTQFEAGSFHCTRCACIVGLIVCCPVTLAPIRLPVDPEQHTRSQAVWVPYAGVRHGESAGAAQAGEGDTVAP